MPHRLCLERAKLIPTKPFSRFVIRDIHSVKRGDVRQEVAREEQKASNETQALDDVVAVLVFAALRQRRVDDVTEVRLEANVEKSKQSEDLVDDGFTNRRAKSRCNKQVLNSLQKLHREEEKDTTSKLHVARAGVHPPRGKEACETLVCGRNENIIVLPRAAKPADISPVKHILQSTHSVNTHQQPPTSKSTHPPTVPLVPTCELCPPCSRHLAAIHWRRPGDPTEHVFVFYLFLFFLFIRLLRTNLY